MRTKCLAQGCTPIMVEALRQTEEMRRLPDTSDHKCIIENYYSYFSNKTYVVPQWYSSFKHPENNNNYTLKIFLILTYEWNDKYCKFGNFREGFIFANLCIAKFRENKTLVKWRDHSVIDWSGKIKPLLQIFNIANMSFNAIRKNKIPTKFLNLQKWSDCTFIRSDLGLHCVVRHTHPNIYGIVISLPSQYIRW